jgi:hypothetical protein
MQALKQLGGETMASDSGVGKPLTMSEFAIRARDRADSYHRYHIETMDTPDRQPLPNRFIVKVGKFGLAKFIVSELFQYWGKWDVITSRPCTYGVFSGPVGGFSPRPHLCVGCLRCTVQHPEFTTVEHNPERVAMGDRFLSQKLIETIDEEARKGSVPVRGQGYRGRFGGPGWDGMFTDMSEIVRPSRDGIHGRELIGTSVDIGGKPMRLYFDSDGDLVGEGPRMVPIQVPFVFDELPKTLASPLLNRILKGAAENIDTLAIFPAETVRMMAIAGPHVVPIIPTSEASTAGGFGAGTRLVELDSWNAEAFATACAAAPDVVVGVRLAFEAGWLAELTEMVDYGVTVIHLVSDNHGNGDGGRFAMDLIKEAHMSLLESGKRDLVTLLGTGGVAAADHLPKAIIVGLDAVGLDLPLLIALQGRPSGDLSQRDTLKVKMPRKLDEEWGIQRLMNLSCSWRDQMLEILGAMGIREVRRLRGEMGRAMWCNELEQEAFAEIEGFVRGEY